MYVTPRSRESRIPVLQQAVEQLRFGTLVTYGAGALQATHLPMAIDPSKEPSSGRPVRIPFRRSRRF
jgi:predicted FMN-binding regulatory protein PaiB